MPKKSEIAKATKDEAEVVGTVDAGIIESPGYMIISSEDLQEVIRKIAFETAVETVQRMEYVNEEKSKEYRDKRLRNTKLLLRNYRMLRKGCEEAVWNREVAKRAAEEMDIIMLMKADNDKVVVDSIKQSSEKTAVILAHIDRMIEAYKAYCLKQGDREKRRFKALQTVYLNAQKQKMADIAAKLNVTVPTLYSDLAIAEESLAALLFGVDGLRFTT